MLEIRQSDLKKEGAGENGYHVFPAINTFFDKLLVKNMIVKGGGGEGNGKSAPCLPAPL
jgi:hypothetical protein